MHTRTLLAVDNLVKSWTHAAQENDQPTINVYGFTKKYDEVKSHAAARTMRRTNSQNMISWFDQKVVSILRINSVMNASVHGAGEEKGKRDDKVAAAATATGAATSVVQGRSFMQLMRPAHHPTQRQVQVRPAPQPQPRRAATGSRPVSRSGSRRVAPAPVPVPAPVHVPVPAPEIAQQAPVSLPLTPPIGPTTNPVAQVRHMCCFTSHLPPPHLPPHTLALDTHHFTLAAPCARVFV